MSMNLWPFTKPFPLGLLCPRAMKPVRWTDFSWYRKNIARSFIKGTFSFLFQPPVQGELRHQAPRRGLFSRVVSSVTGPSIIRLTASTCCTSLVVFVAVRATKQLLASGQRILTAALKHQRAVIVTVLTISYGSKVSVIAAFEQYTIYDVHYPCPFLRMGPPKNCDRNRHICSIPLTPSASRQRGAGKWTTLKIKVRMYDCHWTVWCIPLWRQRLCFIVYLLPTVTQKMSYEHDITNL